MVAIARLTLKRAVEQVAREMTTPMSLNAIMEEACRRAGHQASQSTPDTVRNALARLRFVIRCGRGMFGPARFLLDGKALRVKLDSAGRSHARIARSDLEPFYSALEEPPVVTADGRPLQPIYFTETTTRELRKAMIAALRETLQQLSPWGHLLANIDDEAILKKADARPMDTGMLDLRPVLEGLPENEPVDLIVRWDKDRGALVVTARPRGHDDPTQIAAEDKLLADYLVSHLVEGYAIPAGPLVLEAYAQFDLLGRTPGSAVIDVILADSRLRIVDGKECAIPQLSIAHAGRPTYQERRAGFAEQDWFVEWQRSVRDRIEDHVRRLRQAWQKAEEELGLADTPDPRETNVRLLRKPPHDALIEEWEAELKERGLSERVVRRKVNHVRDFAWYLESNEVRGAQHLLEATLSDLEDFFFWTYIRRWARVYTNAAAFALDLRDFYRYQEAVGRIPDARFAELIYRLRDFIQERRDLYYSLNPYDKDFDELLERLFFG